VNLSKAEKARLGAFIVAGVVLLTGGVVVLAGLKAITSKDEYRVSFTESVSGLEPGAQVRFQGLKVGAVDRIGIDPNDPKAIEVFLRLDSGTKLYPGTEVIMESSLLTGFKTINLTPGDTTKDRLRPGATLPARASLMELMAHRAEEISEKIERVAINLDKWTGDDNRMRFESLADSTQKLVTEVDLFVVEVRDPLVYALEEIGKTSASVRGVTSEAELTLKEARSEIQATLVAARETMESIQKIVAAIDPQLVRETLKAANRAATNLDTAFAADEMGKVFGDLRAALVNVTRLMQSLDLTVRAGRDDLVTSLKYVRQATQDLRDFSRIIAQDPSVLLRGKEATE
jgi:phospholipid/cholesterol/gamma-HCH transport system substrate-binding protein